MADRRVTRSRVDRSSGAPDIRDQLGMILARLTALENSNVNVARGSVPLVEPVAGASSSATDGGVETVVATGRALPAPSLSPPPLPPPSVPQASASGTVASSTYGFDATDRIIGALSALSKVRSNHFYISNYDPSVNDIDSWCDEVDRARDLNGWDDNECLSRIANCLKGDAKTWLQEWVTSDRSWSNFKVEFKPLCSRRIDVASILFDVMCTNSDRYTTYADYVRRSLLRLKIVKGLSDDLIIAIIIRGVTDPQIRATAANSKLLPKDLVEFFSNFVKPVSNSSDPVRNDRKNYDNIVRKRPLHQNDTGSRSFKCFSCGEVGHAQRSCPKRSKTSMSTNDSAVATSLHSNVRSVPKISCTFCKKPGHDIKDCYFKNRSETRNSSVNFCRDLEGRSNDIDVNTLRN